MLYLCVAVVLAVLHALHAHHVYVIVTVLLYTAYNVLDTLYAGLIFAADVVTVYVAVSAVVSALYHNALHQFVDRFVVLGAGALMALTTFPFTFKYCVGVLLLAFAFP